MRRLPEAWVDAGRRRVIARALFAQGMTKAEIGRMLNVSSQQIRRDLRTPDDVTQPDGLPIWYLP